MAGVERAHGRNQRDAIALLAPGSKGAAQARDGVHDAQSVGHGTTSLVKGLAGGRSKLAKPLCLIKHERIGHNSVVCFVGARH
jgi:hypothetical protein